MKLQAYRGVSSEYPENTLTALIAAQEQGYDAVELDVTATKDDVFVLCADETINRLVRNEDGSELKESLPVAQLGYEALLAYDFGVVWAPKYKGTQICVLREALQLAKRTGLQVKLNVHDLTDDQFRKLCGLLEGYGQMVGMTFRDADALLQAVQLLPQAAMYYAGPVTEAVLEQLKAVPAEQLTIWLDADAEEELAKQVAQIARLGMGPATEYTQMDRAEALGAEILSTPGHVKPVKNKGVFADMHIHSRNSHDAFYSIKDMCKCSMDAGVTIMGIADHCDMFLCDDDPGADVYSNLVDAYEEIKQTSAELGDRCKILMSVELGEAIWYPVQCKKVLKTVPFDCVVGSVHAVRCGWNAGAHGMKIAYSQFPWQDMTLEQAHEIFAQYFEDLLEMVKVADIDVVAHLTTVTGYYNRRKNTVVDLHCYEPIIRQILQVIIDRRLALEVNTGSYRDLGITRPEDWILKIYREMGGYFITMGTDSHDPKRAAVGYPEVARMLKDMGFQHAFYFEKRRSYQLTL